MQLVKAETNSAKLTIYESALTSCVEAITVIRDELRSAVSSEASTIGEQGVAVIIASSRTSQTLGSDKVRLFIIIL